MQPTRTFNTRRTFHAATARRWCMVATLLHTLVVGGCATRVTPEPLPGVVLTGPAQPTATAVDSVRGVPLPAAASAAPARRPINIRLRPVTVDPLRGPPMYVVDGVILGRRDDGTIDPDAARRALARIDPRTIASIQVLKGDPAVQRFGPAASDGAVLVTMVSHAWRAKAGAP